MGEPVSRFRMDHSILRIPRSSISQSLDDGEELLEDFQKLFESMELSDVTFNVRCRISDSIRSVYVCTALHKTILAARSPLFAAMFKHPSKEKLSGIVNVPDIEPDVFKVLLRYIYIGGAFTADGQISNWTVGRRRQISTGKTEESL